MKKLFLLLGIFALALIAGVSSASAYHYVNHMHGDYYYSNSVSKTFDSYTEKTVVRTPYTYSLNYERFDVPYQRHYVHNLDYGHSHPTYYASGYYSNDYYSNDVGYFFKYGKKPEYYTYTVQRSYI